MNKDGSVVGQTFSGDKYKGEYPTPGLGKETYAQYYKRVLILRKEGFHLGDLSWPDYRVYCAGSPDNEEYIQGNTIP